MTTPKNFKLSELLVDLDVEVKGDPHCLIKGIAPIQQAGAGELTFLNNVAYRKYLATTQASAVILTAKDAKECPVHAVISANPYFAYAKVAAFFQKNKVIQPGIHSSAVIDESATIDSSAAISAHCFIGQGVKIGARVVIGPNTTIEEFAEIGDDTVIASNVSIYSAVKIGQRNTIASGVVIGSIGFGIAQAEGKWHKVPQLGTVLIGDDVDIGANTTIDRGALENTIIENGVKLDNLIQIGHNVQIGAHTVMAGCVAVAGTVTIGKHCMIGGATCFAGHITICDKVMITGMSSVTKSIIEPGIYSSGVVGMVPNLEFRKNNARFHRLENLYERVKKLEDTLKDDH
ncbi:MAG: UDP-3-O-(3-hydroxymyristoyl)glucosamine N-acyltransferase [Gammaproteobacteria bacterium]|nr:UDP-3-O-(3-hydroxymyristoyl)glucosamine N-acyltransferase [Gammaproteobacteria bacterium]